MSLRTRRLLREIACCVILCCGISLFAQQPTTGLPAFGSFAGGPFDTVNLADLDVHFSVPIFGRSGKGIPFSYALSYDGLVWSPVSSTGAAAWTPVPNWGWRAVTEAATGYISYSDFTFTQSCQQGGEFGPYGHTTSYFTGYAYHDSTGGVHPFAGTVRIEDISDSHCGTIGITTYPITKSPTNDNSGYVVSATSSSGTAYGRDGVTYATTVSSIGGGTVTDPNGNSIHVAYTASTKTTTITDTLATTALTVVGTAPTPPNCSNAVTYTYPAPGGSSQIVVNYKQYPVRSYFRIPGIAEFPQTNECLVDTIVLPDNSQYSFTYECTNLGSGCYTPPPPAPPIALVTGRIASVTLPTGGTISYSYDQPAGCGGFNNGNCMMADGSPSYMSRTLGGGDWVYVRANQSGSSPTTQTKTAVTDPAANVTNFNFSGVYQTSRVVHQGTSTVLDSTTTCYNNNFTSCGTATVNQSAYVSRRDVYDSPGGGSQNSILSYLYDQHGNLTTEVDKDYPNGATILRQVNIAPDTALCGSKNICDLPYTVQVLDGSSPQVQKALTTYGYDGNGNTTGVSRWTSGSGGLNTGYSYNGDGTLKQITDVNGVLTTYSYNAGICNGAFPTSVLKNGLQTQYGYNCGGGVVTSVTDPNSASASATYGDPNFWRPTVTTDAALNATDYYYYDQAHFETVANFSSSTIDVLSVLDGYGRPALRQTRENPGVNNAFDNVEFGYDTSGRMNFQSLPFLGSTPWSGGSGGPGTNTSFDALNRPTQITDAGGGTMTYCYNANSVLVARGPAPSGENTKSRILGYDALGRTTSVIEILSATIPSCPSSFSAYSGYVTSYHYDPLGDLTTASQMSTENRSFSYDGLGRMTQEVNPESGTTNYIYDTVAANYCGSSSAFSSPSDLVAKSDANGNHVCYYYDVLHRLTDVGNNNQSATNPCLRFRYDNSTGVQGAVPAGVGIGNVKGRLVEAETDNCGLPITPLTDEWFNYSIRGEVTDAYELTPHSGGYYRASEPYFANGQRQSLQGFLGNGAAFSDLYTYNLDGEGRLNGMADTTGGFTVWSSTTYNPASQPTSVVQHNGGAENFQYDATGRMQQWASTVGATQQIGTLTWNQNGTLRQLQMNDTANSANVQTCSYIYEDAGRVASVNCGTSLWNQNFNYDPYGNLTKTVPAGSTGIAFNPGYNSSNHVNGFLYDAAGNVTLDNLGNTYTYNALGRPITAAGVQMTYDAFGRAVERNTGGTYHQVVYAPTGEVFAYMSGSTLTRYIDPMVAGMAAVHNGDGTGWFQHADWLGSSRLSSDSVGGVYYDRAYAPFGEVYAESTLGGASPVTLNRNFTGQREDTTQGIDDFLLRQYSPSQGRWLMPDPAGLAAVDITNPQTWNRYAYLADNPLNKVDPLGLYCPVWERGCSQGAGSYDASVGVNSWVGVGSGWGDGPDSGCDADCQLQQAEQNAALAVTNANSGCAAAIDGGTGTAAATLSGTANGLITMSNMGFLGPGAETNGSAITINSNPVGLFMNPQNVYLIGSAMNPNYWASGPGYSNSTFQTIELLHELGHVSANNGAPSEIVNDGSSIGGGQPGLDASMQNTFTTEDNCFPQGDFGGNEGPISSDPSAVNAHAIRPGHQRHRRRR